MGSLFSSTIGGAGFDEHKFESTRVLKFNSSAPWQLHFNSVKESSQLMVIYFSASWCGPCKFIWPAIHDMANKFTDVSFIKLDVDELKDVAKEFNVTAMPTFVLWKNGKEVERIIGAKRDELERGVAKHRSLLSPP